MSAFNWSLYSVGITLIAVHAVPGTVLGPLMGPLHYVFGPVLTGLFALHMYAANALPKFCYYSTFLFSRYSWAGASLGVLKPKSLASLYN